MAPESDFINQSILARELGLSVAEALSLLAERGYWDAASRHPTETATQDGLAKTIDHPLTGQVTMWSRRLVDQLRPPETGDRKSRDSVLVKEKDQSPSALNQVRPVRTNASLSPDRPIEIFIASSIVEFGTERPQIAGILHAVDRSYVVYLAEYDPDGDSQESINRHLETAEYFVAIIGRKLGKKTALEIDLALRRYREQGTPRVKFFIQNFADNHLQRSPEVEEFAKELFEEGVHYPREFADQQELIDQVELFFRRLKKT